MGDRQTRPVKGWATRTSGDARTGIDARTVFRIVLAISTLPIPVAAIRNGMRHWYPSADAGITAVRTIDVFSAHPPMFGLPAFPSTTSTITYGYLGAPINYLLAIPVKLLGVSWGLLIGMAVFNTFWYLVAMWLVRRRVGDRVAVLGCVFGVSLLWAVGSQILVDPTPVHAGMIAAFTFAVAAWSVADGDPKALLPLATAGSFLLLVHLKYLLFVPVVAAVAIVCWIVHLVRRRRRASDWQEERRAHRRGLLLAVAATLLLWIPTIAQQVFESPGNVANLLRALVEGTDTPQHAGIHGGVVDSIRVVFAPVVAWPLWFRDSLANPRFTMLGPSGSKVDVLVGCVVFGVMVLTVGVAALRRRDTTAATGLLVAIAASAGWVVSGIAQASKTGWAHRYYESLWPAAMFFWFTVVVAVIRSAPVRARWAKRPFDGIALPVLGVGVAVIAVLSFPIANFGAETSQLAIPVGRSVSADMAQMAPRGKPVIVQYHPWSWAYVSNVVLGLQAAGIDFRFTEDWGVRTYGANRAIDPTQRADARTVMVTQFPTVDASWRLLALSGDTVQESPAAFAATTAKLDAWGRTVTEIRVPPSEVVDPQSRSVLQFSIDRSLASARSSHGSVFDVAQFASLVSAEPYRFLLGSVDIPGVSRVELDRWLHDRSLLVQNRAVLVYLQTAR